MSRSIGHWLRERIPFLSVGTARQVGELVLKEPLPTHMKNWFYALGVTPFVLFLYQVVTGILLTVYYVPSPDAAFESVRVITEEVRMGFWVRGLHRWGSSLMVIAIILHILRVFFTRAYRRPREVNWMIGVLLLFTTLGLCFTGYSLVYNQLSYWATTVGTNMIKEVPLLGSLLLDLLRGGSEVGSNTLTRFYNLHIGILPGVVLLLIIVHIVLVRLHGVSPLEGREDEKETYPFYPEHFYHGLVIALFLLACMSALAAIYPPGLGEPANASVTPNHIKPEWYFFAVFSILKFVPLTTGIAFFIALVIALLFWPFLDGALRKRWPSVKAQYWIGSITVVLFLLFTVYEIIVH